MKATKNIVLLTALAILAVIVAACAAPVAPSAATSAPVAPSAATSAPSASAGGTSIVISMWSGPEYDNLVRAVEAYKVATGVEVIIEEIARDAYEAKITSSIVAGAADYDVIYVNASSLPKLVEADGLEPLENFGENPNLSDLRPAADALVMKGVLYGLPTEADSVLLYYRKDIFSERGLDPPETWEEMLEIAAQLSNPPDMYGTIVAAKLPSYIFYDFSSWLLGAGAKWTDENLNPTWTTPAAIEAIERYAGAVRNGIAPPDAAAIDYPEQNQWFQEGRVAMMVQWIAATAEIFDCERSPAICDKVDVTVVPRYGSGSDELAILGSLYSWSIPKASQNKQAAYDFINWVTSPEGGKVWAISGGIPANQKALNDPEVLAKRPDFQLLARSLKGVYTPPITTVTSELVENASIELSAAVLGTKTAQDTASAIQSKWEKILKKAGLINR